jgi:hypothetical protein
MIASPMTTLPWLEDFNDQPPQADAPQPELDPAPITEAEPDPRLEGWQEGFIAGHRQAMLQRAQDKPALTAVLCEQITKLQDKLDGIAENAAAQISELLVEMLAASIPPDWPEPMQARLADVIAAVKPSFWLDPKLHIRLDPPALISLQDLPALASHLDTWQETDWAVAWHWDTGHSPDATRTALQAALRDPVADAGADTAGDTPMAALPS